MPPVGDNNDSVVGVPIEGLACSISVNHSMNATSVANATTLAFFRGDDWLSGLLDRATALQGQIAAIAPRRSAMEEALAAVDAAPNQVVSENGTKVLLGRYNDFLRVWARLFCSVLKAREEQLVALRDQFPVWTTNANTTNRTAAVEEAVADLEATILPRVRKLQMEFDSLLSTAQGLASPAENFRTANESSNAIEVHTRAEEDVLARFGDEADQDMELMGPNVTRLAREVEALRRQLADNGLSPDGQYIGSGQRARRVSEVEVAGGAQSDLVAWLRGLSAAARVAVGSGVALLAVVSVASAGASCSSKVD